MCPVGVSFTNRVSCPKYYFTGLAVVIRGQTTVAWWSYIIALILGSVVAVRSFFRCVSVSLTHTPQPFSILLTARLGHGVYTSQLMKMVAGILQPGKPVANLYVSDARSTCHRI